MQAPSVPVRKRKKISNVVRDRIVLAHLPLLKAIAVRVHENLPVHVDLDDLVHAGVLGLFDAASKYTPDQKVKVVFHSYAKYRIKGPILDSLRQLWASRDLRKRQKMVEAINRELTEKLQRTPTELEVAEKMGVGLDRWRRVVLERRTVGLISPSTYSSDHESGTPEFPAAAESQPDSMCAREQLREVLAIAVRTLPERYQKVVLLYCLHQRNDHERNWRPGHQRKSRFPDPQDGPRENGQGPALGRHSFAGRTGVGLRSKKQLLAAFSYSGRTNKYEMMSCIWAGENLYAGMMLPGDAAWGFRKCCSTQSLERRLPSPLSGGPIFIPTPFNR